MQEYVIKENPRFSGCSIDSTGFGEKIYFPYKGKYWGYIEAITSGSECRTLFHQMQSFNILVDPGTTFQSTNQISGPSLQLKSSLGLQPGLGASIIHHHFPLILGRSHG